MINGIVGVGIFGLPAVAASMVGPAAVVGYFICIGVYGLAGLCFAEIGSRVPEAGGLYAYITAAWGSLAGAVAGTLYWTIMGVVANAAVATFLADHLGALFPSLSSWPGRAAFLVVLDGIFAVLNVCGRRSWSVPSLRRA